MALRRRRLSIQVVPARKDFIDEIADAVGFFGRRTLIAVSAATGT